MPQNDSIIVNNAEALTIFEKRFGPKVAPSTTRLIYVLTATIVDLNVPTLLFFTLPKRAIQKLRGKGAELEL